MTIINDVTTTFAKFDPVHYIAILFKRVNYVIGDNLLKNREMMN